MAYRPFLAFGAGFLTAITLPAIAQRATLPSVGIFPDVKTNAFFSDSVEKLVRNGVLKGYDNGNFGPQDQVTRGQVAVMLDRYDHENIDPIRQQLDEIRTQLNIGRCGDGRVQTGEECDDGNTFSGDGCSSKCLKEVLPQPHMDGESYRAANWECYDGQALKQLDEICRGPKDWWTVADKFCSGRCSASGKCGVNNFTVNLPCNETYQTSESPPSSPSPPPSSSSSSSTGQMSCNDQEKAYKDTLSQSASCTKDSDCTVFSYPCPFVGCNEPVIVSSLDKLSSAASALDRCRRAAHLPSLCGACPYPPPVPSCVAGRCQVQRD